MEVRRTAPVKLIVPDERRDDLHESARQFLHCANRAAEFCWDDRSSRSHPTCRPGDERVCRTVETSEACEPAGVHIVEYAL